MKKSKLINFKVSDADHAAYVAAAREREVPLSELIRRHLDRLVRAAKQNHNDGEK
jgi:predicted HicB family RNase H-like nuclease